MCVCVCVCVCGIVQNLERRHVEEAVGQVLQRGVGQYQRPQRHAGQHKLALGVEPQPTAGDVEARQGVEFQLAQQVPEWREPRVAQHYRVTHLAIQMYNKQVSKRALCIAPKS